MAGPVIGGYLAHFLSWRWIFWINLPLALLALVTVRRALRHLPAGGRRHRIGVATALTAFSRMLGGAVGVAVLTTALIALLRHGGVAVSDLGGGEDVLMQLFQRVMAGTQAGGDAAAVRHGAEHAFRLLFLMSAGVSLLAPFLVARLPEKVLRGSAGSAAAAAAAAE